MDANDRLRKMHNDIADMNVMLPELYEVLPRNDFYRLKQLLEEMQEMLKKHANG
ncbi:MAG: hypothetical protein ACRDF4_03740 [Rhabdochlamydiaceae bacterium]